MELLFTILLIGTAEETPEPKGHYIKGLYIPTHITECVDFCFDRDRVDRMTEYGDKPGWVECKCHDGSIKLIPIDPYMER